MKFKIFEDGAVASAPAAADAPAVADSPADTGTEWGTTSANIAPVELKLGQVIKRKKVNEKMRKQLKEGFVHPDYIQEHISISFYNDHKSNETFERCFDVGALQTAVINAYSKRAQFSQSMSGLEIFDMNITQEDATTDEIAFWLNIHCKHKHIWVFKGFAQHDTQVIFGTKTGKRTVVIHQHFPRTLRDKAAEELEN